ncbi:hypothetical protein [uncultured Faecalicoccus sp.]|uniref:hypothetical protein n=1 Tax=uncultured Faecalicoccus sp. TaxID=1971760 RepID=UPI002609543E|nr:hypothetical protein [uncultured Faecalicoccus sp.]
MDNSKQTKAKRDEIDDFAKALLDKKTDMAIYNSESHGETEETDPAQDRKAAEETLSSALDMLRMERGQSTIEEEEKQYYYSRLTEDDDFDDEDFTTSSIEELKTQSFDVNQVTQALHEYDQDREVKTKLKVDMNKSNATGVAHDSKQEQKAAKKKKSKLKWVLIAVFVLLFAGCLGGYAYKVYVWNPAHIITDEMQQAYDKLVSYADEYGSDLDSNATLMSDSERFELLDMDKDYETLNDIQKEDINAYFKEQTNKTYKQLVKELRELRDLINDEANASYKTISDLLVGWSSLTAEQQYQVLDLYEDYQNLPEKLKERINELSQANAGYDFTKLNENIRKAKEAQTQKEDTETSQELASLQEQLQSVQTQLTTYQNYGEALQMQLQEANAAGDSATANELSTAIASNDEAIGRLQEQLTTIQSQIEALQ